VRRITLVLTAAAIMVAMLVFSAGSAWALRSANGTQNGGDHFNNEGFSKYENERGGCGGAIITQADSPAPGQVKKGATQPANCDHNH
jgi:hypothetical protein